MPYSRRKFIRNAGLITGSAIITSSYIPAIPESENGNKLILLGTQGGPFIRSYKPGPAANLIVYNNMHFVVDTGYGTTFKLIEAGAKLSSLKYVFITHHHSDHNLDLGPLLYNAWIAGLSSNIEVYAPAGLNSLLNAYWESNRFDIETRIKDEQRPDIRKMINTHEYTEGQILSNDGVVVTALRNIHPPIKESYALKFNLNDKVVVFSGDTAYYPALAQFSLNADYLVHEVMYGPAIDAMVKRRANATHLKESILSHHTSAEDVGKIASDAKVKTLVLNHFVPPDDASLTDDVWMNAVQKNFSGKIIVGKDMLQLAL
jgi:ribonuclease BN (tRNA processing enzyme)